MWFEMLYQLPNHNKVWTHVYAWPNVGRHGICLPTAFEPNKGPIGWTTWKFSFQILGIRNKLVTASHPFLLWDLIVFERNTTCPRAPQQALHMYWTKYLEVACVRCFLFSMLSQVSTLTPWFSEVLLLGTQSLPSDALGSLNIKEHIGQWVRFNSMQAFSQLTMQGKFRRVARNPLPTNPLPMVDVCAP